VPAVGNNNATKTHKSESFMNKIILSVLAGPAVAIPALVLAGCSTSQPTVPKITVQPPDQMVQAGAEARLSVAAMNGAQYQWWHNGAAIPGATNATLAFDRIGIQDAGNYSCVISSGAKTNATRMAALLVYVRLHAANAVATPGGAAGVAKPETGGTVVYAMPVSSGGSSGGGCPGNYAGYVSYVPGSGWGFAPIANDAPYTASDNTGRMDTSVVYTGRKGDNGCNQTSVTIPNPPYSTAYRFTVYFPSNVPTTNYPLTLTGF
jgi:hypothetical protein